MRCVVLIEMALVLNAKDFISKLHKYYAPKDLNESIIYSYTYFNSNPSFRVTYMKNVEDRTDTFKFNRRL